MRLKSVRQIRGLRGKRVLLRVDFNVPIGSGGTIDAEGDERISRALPTIQYLQKNRAVVVLATHLGRPDGKAVAAYRLQPVANYLAKLLGGPVTQLGTVREKKTAAAIGCAKPGAVLMLENLRFDPGEEENDLTLAKALAGTADYYVDDAFGNAHRVHASMVGVTKYCKSYAGLLMSEEVRVLSELLQRPRRPYSAIIGGVKLSTKLAVIETFLHRADHLLLGGNLANTVLKAQGVAVGRSPVEKTILPKLRKLKSTSVKLHLPVDVVTAISKNPGAAATTKAVAGVTSNEFILDIGPDTLRLFDSIMREAKTIVWNGPMGMFEQPAYAAGTVGIIHALAHTSARVIVGGGETVTALRQYLPKPVSEYPHLYLSTGGGAMLQFLEKGTLPALEPLRVR
ncbi:MAG: phosphoglycerate kinase [Patescibacteria group bacterium]|nr:phosphoglycerate kinase [Patescibacteria group bacterium]